ncbi:MAG: 3-dehydro-L-gulonate 2-dehydrogenase [Chitinophagaceae bacterium]|nr:3-dehydro-L-gulonate 2-dehydrogenase [Chitinophagaceae bacterium]
MQDEIRIGYNELKSVFYDILCKLGFTNEKAEACATVFANNSLDGVYTHGVNRFPRFVQNVKDGVVIADNEPVKTGGTNALEQWDGQLGPGPLNAMVCTDRAIELAKQNGIACVALANTNHWMRGGAYAWQATKKGFAFICWTNTIANMPAWGAFDSRLGNNPLIMGIPYKDEAIVLDMAISQFSYGAMEKLAMKNKQLEVPGGFNESGEMTKDPQEIIKSNRSLPVGYWKGSGLSLLLDILAAVLSGGKSTSQVTEQKSESALSQVFIAIDLQSLHNFPSINLILNNIITDYHAASPDGSGNAILFPGERVVQTRKQNLVEGIPVNSKVWEQIQSL